MEEVYGREGLARFVFSERAAELDAAETEFIAEVVGGLG